MCNDLKSIHECYDKKTLAKELHNNKSEQMNNATYTCVHLGLPLAELSIFVPSALATVIPCAAV